MKNDKSLRYLVRRTRGTRETFFWQPGPHLRAAGFRVRTLPGDFGAAVAECARLNTELDIWRAGQDRTMAPAGDTVSALVDAYLHDRRYLSLAPRTRREYAFYLERIRAWAGDRPARSITKRDVEALYLERAGDKPRAAAYLVQVGRVLFGYGVSFDLVPGNPFSAPAISNGGGTGLVWPAELVEAAAAAADRLGLPSIGDAVVLNYWLGQRLGDLLTLRKDSVTPSGQLRFRQGKTRSAVVLDVDAAPAIGQVFQADPRPALCHDRHAALLDRPDGRTALYRAGLQCRFRPGPGRCRQLASGLAGRLPAAALAGRQDPRRNR